MEKISPKRKKTGGRQKGSLNKTTIITRQLMNDLAEDMLPQILKDLAELSPEQRVRVFLKLCEFQVPKPQTISLDLITQRTQTIEDRLIALSAPPTVEAIPKSDNDNDSVI